jgi:hypothetical protein
MKRKREEKLDRSQKSVWYMTDDLLKARTDVTDRAKYYGEFYPTMFIQDVKLRIMPYGGRISKKEFSILLDPPDPKIQKLIEEGISPNEYHHDLAGVICDFVADCAVNLLLYETMTYEVVYLSERKSGKYVGFELVQINPYTLVQHGNRISQLIPDERGIELSKREKITFEPERLITFKLPVSLQRKMDQIMESMVILSKTTPDFFMKEMASGKRVTAYNVTTHNHLKNVALARITKDIGWDGRWSFDKDALEYYLIYRRIRFEKFLIELRDSIIKTLNATLELVGKQLGFTNRILINGLPTIDDVKAAFDHLSKGDIPFKDVLEPFQGY